MGETMKHNKRNYDVVVVGGGLSGLIAAAVAAESGKRTALLTKGAGTLSISAGVIDLLGYVNGVATDEPLNAIASLPEGHPYKIIGKDNIVAALDYFQKCTAASGFAYKTANGRNGASQQR
jgi:glycerol-3-phosphate dehydrogenase subunit B